MKLRHQFAFLITFLALGASGGLHGGRNVKANPNGEKAAEIYCFMRNNNNIHEVSWEASYAVIKRQSTKLFKISPKNAAVMIIETVVSSPDKYNNCGQFLGDLFGASKIENRQTSQPLETQRNNRYSY